jgi:hypothetical protein
MIATAMGVSLVTGTISTTNATKIVIKALLLRNLSLSISEFCVRFTNYINYTNLLLNISNIILEAIK